jgi:hypothetical protein
MGDSACAICESPLRNEIDKKDETWKADRTIRWAKKHGVKINRTTLARHRADHNNARSAGKSKDKAQSKLSKSKSAKPTASLSNDLSVPTDMLFLDAVRDQVFKRLKNGDYDLKLESAFKAIEIKYRIADESRNEKLLLEILAEIRADELNRSKSGCETTI